MLDQVENIKCLCFYFFYFNFCEILLRNFILIFKSSFCRYSCFYHQICSLWMSFGVYVTGVLFQTAYFVSFILISHGYCIMYEHLSISDRRTTAALGCVYYLTLVGYRASVPYFTVSFPN
jgi:hypothetical protein